MSYRVIRCALDGLERELNKMHDELKGKGIGWSILKLAILPPQLAVCVIEVFQDLNSVPFPIQEEPKTPPLPPPEAAPVEEASPPPKPGKKAKRGVGLGPGDVIGFRPRD